MAAKTNRHLNNMLLFIQDSACLVSRLYDMQVLNMAERNKKKETELETDAKTKQNKKFNCAIWQCKKWD